VYGEFIPQNQGDWMNECSYCGGKHKTRECPSFVTEVWQDGDFEAIAKLIDDREDKAFQEGKEEFRKKILEEFDFIVERTTKEYDWDEPKNYQEWVQKLFDTFEDLKKVIMDEETTD